MCLQFVNKILVDCGTSLQAMLPWVHTSMSTYVRKVIFLLLSIADNVRKVIFLLLGIADISLSSDQLASLHTDFTHSVKGFDVVRSINNVSHIHPTHNALAKRIICKRKHEECGSKRLRVRLYHKHA
jgi:hypothetical protein